MTVKMKVRSEPSPERGLSGKPELKEPLACEAAEVPIGVGFLNRAVGKPVSCSLRIRVPVIAGIWVVPRAFVPCVTEAFFFFLGVPHPVKI